MTSTAHSTHSSLRSAPMPRRRAWAVPPLFGAAAAAGVAQTALLAPGAHEFGSALHVIAPVVFVAVALVLAQGMPRRYGPAVTSTLGLVTVGAVLLLFSFGLGFVASGMGWAVVSLAVLAFGLTTGVAALAYSTDDEHTPAL